MKKAKLIDDNILLKFKGSDFSKILKMIKQLPVSDRKFITATSEWSLKYSVEYVEMLHKLNFDLSPELYMKFNNGEADEGWKDIEIPEKYSFLFPYQRDAMRFSIYHGNRVLQALDMGLGKSIVSLSLMDHIGDFPTLIVCPSTVKVNWRNEYYKFLDGNKKIKIIESSKEMVNYRREFDILIINYELLARNMKKVEDAKGNISFIANETLSEFYRNRVRYCILDEIHKIKNPDAQTTHAVGFICKSTKSITGLTGTPLTSSSKDVYSPVHLLNSDLFKNYYSFVNRYCYSKVNYKAGGIKVFFGARNNLELNSILTNNVMFRLTKAQVGKQGEKPLVSVIPIKMKNPKKYKELTEKLNDIDDSVKGFALANKMKLEAWEQKKENLYDRIKDMLEESDEKFVIFARNKKVIDDMMKKFGKIAVKIDGSVSTKGETRQNIIDNFVKSKTQRIFMGGIDAVGVGSNGLQFGSSTAIFIQWVYTFSATDQASSRVDRTGQENQVNIYHFPAEDTIEETFMDILDNKAIMSKEVIDGAQMDESEMLGEILRITKRKLRREDGGKI